MTFLVDYDPGSPERRKVVMNIFILDEDIERCAQYHCDQHVNKMVLESAQMLCTALNKKGFTTPYRSTHINHPCVLWIESSYDHFEWLKELALELNREGCLRYNRDKDHASIAIIQQIENHQYERAGSLPFAQAMPDQYKIEGDPVSAYRAFYIGEKSSFATWRNREIPAWYESKISKQDLSGSNV
ncbi:MAG: hypothetical protein ACI82A_003027 [Candidatus Azotimanducaceae bacterium]|jgi:hypothetical protein